MNRVQRAGRIFLFVGIAFLPSLSAVFVQQDSWYADLSKPVWNPPPWIFGPVWTGLYLMIGLAGYYAWTCGGRKNRWTAFAVYGAQLVLNAVWTPLFFGLHGIGWALTDLILLWILVLVCIGIFGLRSRLAAWLMMPYFIWISFAGTLNIAILLLN